MKTSSIDFMILLNNNVSDESHRQRFYTQKVIGFLYSLLTNYKEETYDLILFYST